MFLSILSCLKGETIMLATRVPLAATAGTPMPGQTESPVHTNPLRGVFGPANLSRPVGHTRGISVTDSGLWGKNDGGHS